MDKNGTFFRVVSLLKKKKKRSFVFKISTHRPQHNQRPSAKRLRPNPNPTSAKKNARARERERERETTSLPFWCRASERKKASLSRDQITTISSSFVFETPKYLSGSRSKNRNHHHPKKKISFRDDDDDWEDDDEEGVVDENDVSDLVLATTTTSSSVGFADKNARLCEGEEETNKYPTRGARLKTTAPRWCERRRLSERGHSREDGATTRGGRRGGDEEGERGGREQQGTVVQVLWKKIVTGCVDGIVERRNDARC